MKLISALLLFFPLSLFADQMTVEMYSYKDPNHPKKIGKVLIEDSRFSGVLIQPELTNLPPGTQGFHVHAMPSCDPKMHEGKMEVAGSAGGHYDPQKTNKHEGPYGEGHLGDLPILVVNADGTASLPTLAPRLKVSDFKGRSLMIHVGSDNYSDDPKPNGGGGARLACGVM